MGNAHNIDILTEKQNKSKQKIFIFFIFMFLFHDKAVKIHLYMSESGKIRPEISEETIDPNIKEVLYERFFYEYPYGKYCH